MTRRAWIAAILLAVAPVSRGADAVRIAEIGIKGYYLENQPTSIRLVLLHGAAQSITVDLRIRALSFPAPHVERVDTFSKHVQLGPNEQRQLDMPVLLQSSDGASVEVDELDDQGRILGHDATFLEPSLQSTLIGILCDKQDACQQVESQISFSGTSSDQTDKSKYLKFVTIENPPQEAWEYSAVETLIVARPPWQMETAQRDAVESFAREGRALILVDDQTHDPGFLSAYRSNPIGVGPSTVGRGKVFFIPSLASNILGSLYAGLNLHRALEGWTVSGRTNDELDWIRRRFSVRFRFPTLTWLLVWLSAYLLIAGVGNFVMLRKLNRREWGWITLPCISLLFAASMYFSSVSTRPHMLRADDVTVYWMDEFSPLAFVERGERISSNRRQSVDLSIGGDVILTGDRNRTGSAVSPDPFSDDVRDAFPRWNVRLGPPLDVELRMLQWSFRDLEFSGIDKLPGTVRRLDATHLRNETGKNFRQAMYVDKSAIYLFGAVPDASLLDLASADKKSLEKTSNAVIFGMSGFPTALAEVSIGDIAGQNRENSSRSKEDTSADFAASRNVDQNPFDLIELVRGWPADGGHAFDGRSGLFFGLSDEAHPLVSIPGKQFHVEGHTVTIVSYERKQ